MTMKTNGTIGNGYVWRTVEMSRTLESGRILVIGDCRHTKEVKTARAKGDTFRCLACAGGRNIGGPALLVSTLAVA